MSQSAVCNHTVSPGCLSIVPGPDSRIEASRQFRGLGKSPCQILVPVLLVAGSLAFAVARPASRDLSAIGRVVAGSSETTHGTCLKRYRERQNVAHTGDGGQTNIFLLPFDFLLQLLFNLLDLTCEEIYGLLADLACQGEVIILFQQRRNHIIGQPTYLSAPNTRACVTCNDVL